ncbi:MAG: Farnesyl diphosphate synthase [Candidatus Omnitrophica bacterium ADurb.Bin277]|nr:MAG: Farnesyl diphosphate synthase [Candidatus Omnitrophica bacterium ADurb.Bin277]
MEYGIFFKKHLGLIEREIRKLMKKCEGRPLSIHRAMQYAVFTGGKRFRPVLTLAVCEACGGRLKDAIPAACAIELIHTYSLVHDDLPALDNDNERRGKPSCHKKFGEAAAILAGDGLLTLAFQVLGGVKPFDRAARLVLEVSTAAGAGGMIGGQVEDIETAENKIDLAAHDFICAGKTGALIRAGAVAGAISAGASSKKIAMAGRYGALIGLAFQVVDDLLDGDGYCRFMPRDKAVKKAERLIREAKKTAVKLGRECRGLGYLADFLGARIPKNNRE